jgi:hypothetical protein
MGLHAFSTTDEAVYAIQAVEADYGKHAKAAREMAAEYFDSSVVLSSLLSRIGL